MKTEHDFRQLDQAIERTLVSHQEALRASIERGLCLKCSDRLAIELNPLNITFRCSAECGWFCIYPIRTIGNSERAKTDESLDLVAIAEREVVEKAKAFAVSRKVALTKHFMILPQVEEELLSATTLLEAREAMMNTAHLDPPTEGKR